MPHSSGFIFLCSRATEKTCFNLSLLGGGEGYQSQTDSIYPGDKLFLYNYQTEQLHGIFRATSESQFDIIPEAWKEESGMTFPWQVRFEVEQQYKPLSKADFESIIGFSRSLNNPRNYFPQVKLTEWQVRDLERIFRDPKRLPTEEKDFRKEFPAGLFTLDGHRVRSKAEVFIDDWLYRHCVIHAYEKKVPVDETLYSDFFIPYQGTENDGVYIEFWGSTEKKYVERREYKTRIYKKYGLKLIELEHDDINYIDDEYFQANLIPKLREFFTIEEQETPNSSVKPK